MNTLYCINCRVRTPRNFADARYFDGVYCARCAPHYAGIQPPSPPTSEINAVKRPDRCDEWVMHLRGLAAGVFGPPGSPSTLLRYWMAQAASGYPGARENVEYFRALCQRISEESDWELPEPPRENK